MNVRSFAVLQFFGVGKTEPKVELTDLADVNIIYGPNGVGKTVTARALGAIFWRNSEQEARPYIHAQVEDGDASWLISIEGGRYVSMPPNPPVTLPEGHRSRYFLSLHDLLRADDADLARVIQEEIQGGSLEEAAAELGFTYSDPNRNVRERREYDAAVQEVKEVERFQDNLYEQEKNLDQLRDKLKLKEIARHDLALYMLLEKVRMEGIASDACQELQQQYQRDYPGIQLYLPNDLENYTQARRGLQQAEERRTMANAEALAAREQQQAQFPEGQLPPSTAELAAWTDWIETWSSLEKQHGEQTSALNSAREVEQGALDDIRREEDAIRLLQKNASEIPATLDAEALLLLDGHVDALRRMRGRLDDLLLLRRQHDEALASAEARLRDDKEPVLQQARDDMRDALERWGGSPPGVGDITEVEQKIHGIRLTDDQLNAAGRELDASRQKIAQTRLIFDETLSDEHLAGVNQQISTAGLDRLLDKYGDLSACDSLLALLRSMAPDGDVAAREWLKTAIRILEDWLGSTPSARIMLPSWWTPAYWGAAMLLTVISVWGCQRLPGAPWLMLVPIMAFVLLIIAGLALPRLLAPADSSNRPEHEAKYQQLGAPPVGMAPLNAWEQSAVQLRLTEYREKQAELTGKLMLNAELTLHCRQQEGNRADVEKEVNRLRQELHAQIGFDGPENATALARLIHQLVVWQQANAEYHAKETVVRDLEARMQRQLVEISSAIAAWGFADAPESSNAADRALAEVRIALEEIEQKVAATSSASNEVEAARLALAETQRTLAFDEKQRLELISSCQHHAEAIRERAAGCVSDTIDEENSEQWVAILHKRRTAFDDIERQLHEKEQLIRNSRQLRERQQGIIETVTAKLAELAAHIDDLRGKLTTAFAAYHEAVVTTPSEATRRLQSLRERKNEYDKAALTIEGCEKTERDTADAASRFHITLEEITRRLGLPAAADEEIHTHNEGQLRILADTLPAYATMCEERVKAVTRYESARLELEHCDGYDARIEELTLVELQGMKAAANSEVGAIEPLKRTITETELEVNRVRSQHELEKAIAQREAAKAKLLHLRDEVIRQNIGGVLVDWLRSESDHNSSEVLRHARILFSEITAGRYELKVSYSSDRPYFEAIDTRDPHTPRTLEMLSSATRIQLLIAVRLAFLEVQESGSTRLPLVLDEVLGNSDDQRAEVVVDSILNAISTPHRRRQLFYFTGQLDEVAKWQAREHVMQTDAHASALRWRYSVIGSERVPSDQAAIIVDPLPDMAIPAPAPGMSYAAYGRELSIPPFNPAVAANSVHLWYVLSRPDELHHALRRRIYTLGQLEWLLKDGGDQMIARLGISERDGFTAEVHEAITIIRCLCEIWRDYHGNPLTRDILDASPMADATYFDQVVSLAHECEGDATRFLAGLPQIPRIRQARIDDLTAYLREQGCLPLNQESLTTETLLLEINARLCASSVTPDAAIVDTILMRVGMGVML